MVNLNTYQLHLFLVAAETLNFTKTAQRLEVTQPSISQNIQSLEDHFGVELFTRSGRTVELTDAGVALVPLAREIVFLTVHAEEMMASLKGDIHGHLIVGCSTPSGRYILPKLLTNFHKRYPNVRANCKILRQSEALHLLEEGTIHLALVGDPVFIPDIEYRKFSREETILIAPPNHPFSDQKEIQINDLLMADFILPEEGLEIHTNIRQALAEQHLSIYQLNTLVSLGSLEAIALSVQEGLGVGFVPSLLVNRLVKDKVVPITVKGLEICREIYVGTNMRRSPTAAQCAFLETLFMDDKESVKSLNTTPELMGV